MVAIKRVAKIAAFLLVALNVSCNSSENHLPDGILSQDKMIDVMVDLQMMEAAHKNLKTTGAPKQKTLDTSYQIVFNKHQTSWAEYDSSMRAYTLHPALFADMLDEVGTRLNSNSNTESEYDPDAPQL